MYGMVRSDGPSVRSTEVRVRSGWGSRLSMQRESLKGRIEWRTSRLRASTWNIMNSTNFWIEFHRAGAFDRLGSGCDEDRWELGLAASGKVRSDRNEVRSTEVEVKSR